MIQQLEPPLLQLLSHPQLVAVTSLMIVPPNNFYIVSYEGLLALFPNCSKDFSFIKRQNIRTFWNSFAFGK